MDNITPLMPVYDRAEISFVRGQGSHLYDDQGKKYLDFVAGMAVVGLGHCHPYVVSQLKTQAETLWTCSNLFHTPQASLLAQRLVDLTFAESVFFQNSGVEAWECGVKTIRKYFSATKRPERFRIISFQGCFHGRTLAAIAASKAPKMIDGFGPVFEGFDLVPWNDIEAVRRALSPHTAAIMIEPIAGEGGIKQASPAFLTELRALCDSHELLLFYDEIQCGMGRTGKLFAHEWSGVMPDVMCVAKALGNGFPIGACLATAQAAQGMTAGTHGSTFGGNPLAMAVGNAVLDVMTEPNFLPEVIRKGDHLAFGLEKIIKDYPDIFIERRGQGLLQGLVCRVPHKLVLEALRLEGFLSAGANDNVIRLLPPLIVTDDEIGEALTYIESAAKKLEMSQ